MDISGLRSANDGQKPLKTNKYRGDKKTAHTNNMKENRAVLFRKMREMQT